MPKELLLKICFERGIDVVQPVKDQIEDLRLWLTIANLNNVPHSWLIATRVNDFHSQEFEVDSNETSEEILRRVSPIYSNRNFFDNSLNRTLTIWNL